MKFEFCREQRHSQRQEFILVMAWLKLLFRDTDLLPDKTSGLSSDTALYPQKYKKVLENSR
jgi:hypothetical protein